MITFDQAEAAVDWLRDNAQKMGQARAERLYLEQWIKTVKATRMSNNPLGSNAAAETAALASDEYADALRAYKYAIEKDETLRFYAVAAEAKVECWRSQESTRRAEGKAYG